MNIFITGAASGIGRGLALKMARPGVTFSLTDRNATALAETVRLCEHRGAVVSFRALDVRDRTGLTEWIESLPHSRVDLAFLCAGVTGGLPPETPDGFILEREEHAREIIDTNLIGTLNALYPLLEILRRQPRSAQGVRGRICVMASVAGFVCFPGTPSYSASKAALDRFVVAQAASLDPIGITLTSVCCGFINTPMVARNRFKMPGLVSTDDAVLHILKGTLRGKRRVVFPSWLVWGSRLMDLLPPRLSARYYRTETAAKPAGMPDF